MWVIDFWTIFVGMFVWTLFYTAIRAWFNEAVIRDDQGLWHWLGGLTRTVVFITVILALFVTPDISFKKESYFWIFFVFFLGYCLTGFWILFDGILNLLRGKEWKHTGSNTIDKLINKYGYWIKPAMFLICATGTLLTFIYGAS
jgi:hypothetical protein